MSFILPEREQKKLRELIVEWRPKIKREACKGWHEWFRGMCQAIIDVGLIFAGMLDFIVDVLAKIVEKTTDIAELMGRDAKQAIVRNEEHTAYRTLTLGLTVDILVSTLIDVAQIKIMGSGVDLDMIESLVKTILPMDDAFRSAFSLKMQKTYFFWLDKLYNMQYKPWLPDPQTAISLFFNNYISERDLKIMLYMYGIDDRYHKYLMDRVSRNPSIQELINFYQFTDVDEKWIDNMLTINNVYDLRPYWWKYIKGIALRDELRHAMSIVKDLYVKGWITEQELNDLLFKYKARPEERDVLYNVWRRLREKELQKYYLDKHIQLLRRKRINCKTLEERARMILKDPRLAQALAMTECARLGYDYPSEDIVI
ncbi:MAG: hypothetical protein QXE70_11105 [Ignisphaera sp.]